MWMNESVRAIAERLQTGLVTSEELLLSYVSKIEASEGASSFAYLNAEEAIKAARASDARRREGKTLGVLDGIPFAAEDRFCTENMPTECNSALLEGYFPPYTADAVSRLTDVGAILLGKLRTRGFLSGELPCEGEPSVCRAVREGFISFALAADTGGELFRTGNCGVAVIKPANGCIPRLGMIASAPSLDGVAIVANTAEDCACVLNVFQEESVSEQPVRVTVGWNGADADALCKQWERAGIETKLLPIRFSEQAVTAYRILCAVEGASELALYDGVRFGRCSERGDDAWERAANTRAEFFSNEEKKRILLGTALLTGEFREKCDQTARRWREQIRAQLQALTAEHTILVLPQNTLSSVCGAFAELSMASVSEDMLVMSASGEEHQMLRLLELQSREGACGNV